MGMQKSRIAQIVLKKKVGGLILISRLTSHSHQSSVVLKQDVSIDQCNRIEFRNRSTHIFTTDFYKGANVIQWRKKSSTNGTGMIGYPHVK